MGALAWIVLAGVTMTGIALLGAVTFLLPARVQQKLLLPLVAFSAGSLLGSAFIFLAWLGIFGLPLWAPLGIALVYAFVVFRWV